MRFFKCIRITITYEEPMKQSFKENIMLNLIYSDGKKAWPTSLIFYGLEQKNTTKTSPISCDAERTLLFHAIEINQCFKYI